MDTVSSYDVGHRLGGGQQDVPIPLTGSFLGFMADGLSPFPALRHPAVNGLGIQLLVGFFHAITLLRQHRIMGQGDSARDFAPSESMENAEILCVFPIFHTARLG